MQISWPVAIIVVAILLCITVLTVKGVLPVAVVSAAISGLLGWLIPNPKIAKEGSP